MSDLFRPDSITAIGSFTALTDADADYLAIDRRVCSGFGDADPTTDTEPAPGQDGALIFPPLDDGQILTIVGDLVVTSTGLSAEAGYEAAVDSLYAELKSAVNDGKTAPIDITHTGGTVKVWKHSRIDTAWPEFWVCRVTFSVIVDLFA